MIKAFSLLLLLMLAGIGVWTWDKLDQPVTLVDVEGQLGPAEKTQIRGVVVEQLKGGLLSTDLDALRDSLIALSWPRRVSVRRVWPDRLVIGVDKAMVVAAWNGSYLTSDGKVVDMAADQSDLVAFECALTQPREAMDLHQRLAAVLVGSGLQIRRLEESSLGEWTVDFDNSLTVLLGSKNMSARLQRVLSVYRLALRERVEEIDRMDGRYSNGVAVAWLTDLAGGAAVAAAHSGRAGDRDCVHDDMRAGYGCR